MRAVLDRDIIVHVTPHGDTEIGSIPPGVGLERLRFDGERLVDLAELSEIWVEPVPGGGHVLHAVEVPGSQLVTMRYADRKRLAAGSDGVPKLMTDQEIDAASQSRQAACEQAVLADEIRSAAGPLDQQTHQLRQTLYLLIDYVLTRDPAAQAALSEVLDEVGDLYSASKVQPGIYAAAKAIRQAEAVAASKIMASKMVKQETVGDKTT